MQPIGPIKINWDVIIARQRESQATRYQRSKGFVKSHQGVVQRAKTSWLDWITVFGKDPKRAWRKRRKLAHQRHTARLQRDPKYAAKCEKRRRDYVTCLTGRERVWIDHFGHERHYQPTVKLCGWLARQEVA